MIRSIIRLTTHSFTCKQPWQHLFLLCLLFLAHAAYALPDGNGNPSTAHNSRYAKFDGFRKQARNEPLRLKLKRIPGSYTDKYDTLRRSISRDSTRRALQASPNLFNASLNVISGSSVGSGAYFVSLSIGTPPQKLFLIADTGSDITWVKCSSSAPTPPPQPKTLEISTNQSFDRSASSTFSSISCFSRECYAWFSLSSCTLEGISRVCGFSSSYSDKSFVSGWLAHENITLGETENLRMVMGCAQNYAGPNFEKAGGVLGLGQGSLSFVSQLAGQPTYFSKFSYCLGDFLSPSPLSGSVVFGDSLRETSFNYTRFIQNPSAESLYYVEVEEVRVGGVALDIPASVWAIDESGNGGTVVDSGTTLAQFAQPAYDTIRNAFQQSIKGISLVVDEDSLPPGLDLCYRTTAINLASMAEFPEFAIVFDGGLVFQPPIKNYFTEAALGITCLAMQAAPLGSFSVVGNLLQQNFRMEFDRLHKQLGIAAEDCSKLPA